MLKHHLKWWLMPFLIGILSACSGGDAFDPVALEAKNTPVDAEEATPTVSNTITELTLSGRQVVATGGSTTFTLTALNAGGATVADAPLKVSVTGTATLSNIPATTGNGTVSFNVSNSTAETVTLSVSSGDVTQTTPISFGGRVSAQVLGAGQPANGTSAARLLVRALNHEGLPLVDLPVSLSFSANSFAVATNASGVTDDNGFFSTDITDTVSETVIITPIIGGVSDQQFSLTFTAVSLEKPHSVTLTLSNNNVVANGTESIQISVIARAEDGTPIQDVPVSLSSSSGSAIFGAASGQTGTNGAFNTTITNTVAESVTITPTAGGFVGDAKQATFITAPADINAANTVQIVELFLSRDTVPANGSDTATITVIARDAGGAPVANVPVAIILSGGSATLASETGESDSSGRFITTISDKQVDSFTITGVVGDARSTPKQIQFTAVEGSTDVVPTSVDLVISNDNQLADGQAVINLTVIVRDNNNTPMSGVDVSFTSSSGSALLASAGGTTGAGGSFSTTITNTVVEQVNITANARGVLSPVKTVSFVATNAISVNLVSATVTNNNQLANGQDAATLTVVARNVENRPVEGANVILVFSSPFAIPAQASGDTGAGGSFTTTITNTVAETFTVVARIGDKSSTPQSITFEAASSITPPAKITTTVAQDGQPADGEAVVQVTVIARDASNTPLQDVPVTLASSSGSALVNPSSGNTGATGAFTAQITNTVAETVTITPTAGGVTGAPVTLSFENSPTDAKPATVELIQPADTIANGTDKMTLTVVAKNQVGSPIVGTTVTLATTQTSALFDAVTGASGVTNASGVFTTSMTSTTVEEFNVIPTAGGITGAPKVVKFVEIPTTDITKPNSIELLTSSPQLLSEGTAEGVTITAVLKTAANTPFENADVQFSATSGVLQVTQGTTDASGQAIAKLTTVGDPMNRTITVTATVGDLTETVDIAVAGTTLNITGSDMVVQSSDVSYTVELKDSAGNGIANRKLLLSTNSPNTIDNTEVMTDVAGRVNVTLSAQGSGDANTLTAVVDGNTDITDTLTFTISDDTFMIDPSTLTDGVALGLSQNFTVTWLKSGVGQTNKQLNISATRGTLSTTIVATNFEGKATFSISSTNAGPTIVTVSAVDGPSAAISFDFIATTPATIEVQASPNTVATNTPGSETEKSEIIAIVRDTDGNLVQNQRVEFTVTDITGGRITPSSAITDGFGRATTAYIAGSSSSATDGVTVKAQVIGTTISSEVKLTVAQRGVFISLGTGNQISELNTTTYQLPYTALVTDINGGPVEGATVNLSVVPNIYGTGLFCFNTTTETWEISETTAAFFANEDTNQNGILDSGEDANSNGILEPGNNVTLNVSSLTTGSNGFANFEVLYPKTYATWVSVKLIAKTTVIGTEDTDISEFMLPALASDTGIAEIPPLFANSPFGNGGFTCPNPKDSE